jgi:hypothetical protein
MLNAGVSTKVWNETEPLALSDKPIEIVQSQEHLGIDRSTLPSTHIAKGRICIARRSLYALMGAGMHGLNGLSPNVSYKLWSVYIMLRMIHSLEALKLSKTDLNMLDNYQITVLKQIQNLPDNTQNVASYLLLGAVPCTLLWEPECIV